MTSDKHDDVDEGLTSIPTDFDWSDFFDRINEGVPDKKVASAAPDSAFQHVEASLDSGVKEGFVVEYLWDEQKDLYW